MNAVVREIPFTDYYVADLSLAEWGRFAASYLGVVALEPLVTIALVRGAAALRSQRWARVCLDERLTLAGAA